MIYKRVENPLEENKTESRLSTRRSASGSAQILPFCFIFYYSNQGLLQLEWRATKNWDMPNSSSSTTCSRIVSFIALVILYLLASSLVRMRRLSFFSQPSRIASDFRSIIRAKFEIDIPKIKYIEWKEEWNLFWITWREKFFVHDFIVFFALLTDAAATRGNQSST